jgi:hypothetical protein
MGCAIPLPTVAGYQGSVFVELTCGFAFPDKEEVRGSSPLRPTHGRPGLVPSLPAT